MTVGDLGSLGPVRLPRLPFMPRLESERQRDDERRERYRFAARMNHWFDAEREREWRAVREAMLGINQPTHFDGFVTRAPKAGGA